MQEAQEFTPEQLHQSNKLIREALAWLHYKMGTTQFYLEETEMALKARGVLHEICNDLQRKIEIVEPPIVEPPAEPKKPYIVDVPMKAEPEAQA